MRKKLSQRQMAQIGALIDEKINDMFIEAHQVVGTTEGIIYEEQEDEINRLAQALNELVVGQVEEWRTKKLELIAEALRKVIQEQIVQNLR